MAFVQQCGFEESSKLQTPPRALRNVLAIPSHCGSGSALKVYILEKKPAGDCCNLCNGTVQSADAGEFCFLCVRLLLVFRSNLVRQFFTHMLVIFSPIPPAIYFPFHVASTSTLPFKWFYTSKTNGNGQLHPSPSLSPIPSHPIHIGRLV
jgi:hypothetical protein